MEEAVGELKKQDISYFSLDEIREAPENELLYDDFSPNADEDDYQLYMSIKEEGIREPLHVSADRFLLSGHRRYAAAQMVGPGGRTLSHCRWYCLRRPVSR